MKSSTSLVTIVIPSYNEEKNIAKVIRDCRTLSKFFKIEIIVVDGGSKDKTVKQARLMHVDKIIAFPTKRGKGADFWAGAICASGQYIVQIDADYQFSPLEIPTFIKHLKKDADVAIGTRFSGNTFIQKGSLSRKNLFGNWVMSTATSIACGRKITDVMAGFKAFRKKALLSLDLRERHFEYEAETVVKAIRMGMRLAQIPISYKKRYSGQSGIRAISDGLNVIGAIIRAKLAKLAKYQS